MEAVLLHVCICCALVINQLVNTMRSKETDKLYRIQGAFNISANEYACNKPVIQTNYILYFLLKLMTNEAYRANLSARNVTVMSLRIYLNTK